MSTALRLAPSRSGATHAAPPAPVASGFTLVEILVAVAISSILFLGVFQLLSDTQRTSQASRLSSQLNDDSRYIFDAIGRDIRMAGYNFEESEFPGLGVVAGLIPDDFLDSAQPIEGYAGMDVTPATTNAALTGLVATEDVLVVRSMSPGFFVLSGELGVICTQIPVGALVSSTPRPLLIGALLPSK